MPEIAPVPEWELDNAWRRYIDEYETKRELTPNVVAQALILFSEEQGILKASFDDYTDGEFVALVFQMHMVRPDMELRGAADLLLEMLDGGPELDAEGDLEMLVAKLHEVGGGPVLRERWRAAGG